MAVRSNRRNSPLRLLNLISDLTASDFGGNQEVPAVPSRVRKNEFKLRCIHRTVSAPCITSIFSPDRGCRFSGLFPPFPWENPQALGSR